MRELTPRNRLMAAAFIMACGVSITNLPRYAVAILAGRSRFAMPAVRLAWLAEVDSLTVSRWENGRKRPSKRSADRLSVIFGGQADDYRDTTTPTVDELLAAAKKGTPAS